MRTRRGIGSLRSPDSREKIEAELQYIEIPKATGVGAKKPGGRPRRQQLTVYPQEVEELGLIE